MSTQTVRVRFSIEYDMEFPADMTPEQIRFRLFDGTYCLGNVIDDLQALDEAKGCLCAAGGKIEFAGEVK